MPHPNVPNPFNPSTRITYEIASRSRIALRVFDVAGRLVRVLEHPGVREPGSHAVLWDGRDRHGRHVASGIYIARLDAAGEMPARRMVLAR